MSEAVTESRSPISGSGALVLVVDDRSGILRLAEKVLRGRVRVLTAQSGSEAIRLLQEAEIAVVICDLEMPGTDGLDVLRATRSLRPAASFILMTGSQAVASATEAKRLGADDYVSKPFEPDGLRERVERALASSQPPPLLARSRQRGMSVVQAQSADRPDENDCAAADPAASEEVQLCKLGLTPAGRRQAASASRMPARSTRLGPAENTVRIGVSFTQDEREALAWHADRSGTTIRDLVREAVAAVGLFQKGQR